MSDFIRRLMDDSSKLQELCEEAKAQHLATKSKVDNPFSSNPEGSLLMANSGEFFIYNFHEKREDEEFVNRVQLFYEFIFAMHAEYLSKSLAKYIQGPFAEIVLSPVLADDYKGYFHSAATQAVDYAMSLSFGNLGERLPAQVDVEEGTDPRKDVTINHAFVELSLFVSTLGPVDIMASVGKWEKRETGDGLLYRDNWADQLFGRDR